MRFMKNPFIAAQQLACRWKLVLLVVAVASLMQQAQAQMYSPPPMRIPAPDMPILYRSKPTFEKGAYQTTDGVWHKGRLVVEEKVVRIRPLDRKAKAEEQEFSYEQIPRYTTQTDTFALLQNLLLPKQTKAIEQTYARQLFRRAGYTALSYDTHQVLLANARPALVLPTKRRDFQLEMMSVVGDHMRLVQQLNNNEVGPDQLIDILTVYTRWKAAQSAASTPATTTGG